LQAFVYFVYFVVPLSTFSQGNLNPSGPPGPTFKTLSQVEPRTPISALPYSITNSGSYYLTTNLTGVAGTNGITISADNVTVDLGGFALIGGGGNRAIYVPSAQQNLCVRNGTIRDWSSPVFAFSTANSQFERLRLSGNGASLSTGSNCAVTACLVQQNSAGIFTDAGSTLADCIVVGNNAIGINTTADATIRNCLSYQNGSQGIFTGDRAFIKDCTVTANGNAGIYTGSSTIQGCTVVGNSLTGIVAGAASIIKECLSRGNQGVGILVGNNSTVSDCQALNNTSGGIYANNACLIKSCTVLSNGAQGIYCVDHCTVSSCLVSSNGSIGIQVGNNNVVSDNNVTANALGVLEGIFVGAANRVEGNTVAGNFNKGIYANDVRNVIVRNTAYTNANQTVNYSVGLGNIFGPSTNLFDASGVITNQNPWANFSY